MKKIIYSFVALMVSSASLFAAPITSPIFMPNAGKILSNLEIGYIMANYDKKLAGLSDDVYKAWNVSLYGKFGIFDRLAINYDVDFDFSRKINREDNSAAFRNFGLGFTGRIVDTDVNKLDIILNAGQEEDVLITKNNYIYIDLLLKYGLGFKYYNLAVSAAARYNNRYRSGDVSADKYFDYTFALENEFIVSNVVTIGLDFSYQLASKIKLKDANSFNKIKSYNNYAVNVDLNYSIDANNYIGLFGDFVYSDVKYNDFKNQIIYNFGIRLTTQF